MASCVVWSLKHAVVVSVRIFVNIVSAESCEGEEDENSPYAADDDGTLAQLEVPHT